MLNLNTLQCESVNLILPNIDASALKEEELSSGNLMMQFQREFNETLECEARQYTKELLNFIDDKIEKLCCDELL